MLVAVVSDSHNNSEAVDLAKKAIAKCDALLFLGDGESDLEKLTEGFKGEVYAVCGNCDFKMMNPVERIVILNGKRIYMTHWTMLLMTIVPLNAGWPLTKPLQIHARSFLFT